MSDLLTHCLVCKSTEAKCQENHADDTIHVDCPVCGNYKIAGSAAPGMGSKDPKLLPYLSCYLRQTWEAQKRRCEVPYHWQESVETHSHSTLGQKLDKLMRLAERRSPQLGVDFHLEYRFDFPLVDATSTKTLMFLLTHAVQIGLIKSTSLNSYEISFKGWEYIERTGLSSQAPARVFVAMSFDDAMDPAYLEGIKPAVEQDCGFVCVNLKHEIHNDDITDRMLAEIRRCQILVADFTQQKHGVYYEAGFALALGKEVIWCVHKDEMNKVHFDTNHRAHITWGTRAELRTRLAAFIQARFQDAIRKGAKP